MPATPLPATTRYFPEGTSAAYFLPVIASASLVPTREEIEAGTDLTGQIASWTGWAVSGSDIATPDLGSTFDSVIPGKTSATDSSMTFYGSIDGDDVRTVLPRGTEGFIVLCDGGDVPSQPCDVFPVRVRSVPKVREFGNSVRLTVEFSITSEPAEDVTIPANTP